MSSGEERGDFNTTVPAVTSAAGFHGTRLTTPSGILSVVHDGISALSEGKVIVNTSKTV